MVGNKIGVCLMIRMITLPMTHIPLPYIVNNLKNINP